MDVTQILSDLKLAIYYRLYAGLDRQLPHWIEDGFYADFNDALRRAETDEERLAVCQQYNQALK